MPFNQLGTINVDKNWLRYPSPLNSSFVRVVFTFTQPVNRYASVFFRLYVPNEGYSAKWYRVYVDSDPVHFFLQLLPIGTNFLDVKLAENRESKGQVMVVQAFEFVDAPTPTPFTIGGEVFLVNGEAFNI